MVCVFLAIIYILLSFLEQYCPSITHNEAYRLTMKVARIRLFIVFMMLLVVIVFIRVLAFIAIIIII